MILHKIETGYFRYDGGEMFGDVPKKFWKNNYPADKENKCKWAMRSLLVENAGRKILIDTGVGDKQDKQFFENFGLFGNDTLINSLAAINISPAEITDIVQTHLHYDHVGGTIKFSDDKKLIPTFPNANIWISKNQWDEAQTPTEAEKDSFLDENISPIAKNKKLRLLEKQSELFPNFFVYFFDGHTKGQIVPHIKFDNRWLIFAADLLPSSAHIYEPIISGFDINPQQSLRDKKYFFEQAIKNDFTILFQHDFYHECGTLKKTQNGIVLDKTFSLNDFIYKKI